MTQLHDHHLRRLFHQKHFHFLQDFIHRLSLERVVGPPDALVAVPTASQVDVPRPQSQLRAHARGLRARPPTHELIRGHPDRFGEPDGVVDPARKLSRASRLELWTQVLRRAVVRAGKRERAERAIARGVHPRRRVELEAERGAREDEGEDEDEDAHRARGGVWRIRL